MENPRLIGGEHVYTHVTLRDLFAGMAMMGEIATAGLNHFDEAPECYAVADAMLAAREPKSDFPGSDLLSGKRV